MNRNEASTIEKLAIGDRFYFSKDKKKAVWEKVKGEVKQTQFQTYTQWAVPASVIDSPAANEIYVKSNFKALRKGTQVVYLRSK